MKEQENIVKNQIQEIQEKIIDVKNFISAQMEDCPYRMGTYDALHDEELESLYEELEKLQNK